MHCYVLFSDESPPMCLSHGICIINEMVVNCLSLVFRPSNLHLLICFLVITCDVYLSISRCMGSCIYVHMDTFEYNINRVLLIQQQTFTLSTPTLSASGVLAEMSACNGSSSPGWGMLPLYKKKMVNF